MEKYYTLIFVLLSSLPFGQISINEINSHYNENFDNMGDKGTTFVSGWTAIRAAGTGTIGPTPTMDTGSGGSNSGNVHNLGANANSERVFGTLASSTTIPDFGASFINNTGNAV